MACQLHFYFVDVWHMSRGRHHSKEQIVEKQIVREINIFKQLKISAYPKALLGCYADTEISWLSQQEHSHFLPHYQFWITPTNIPHTAVYPLFTHHFSLRRPKYYKLYFSHCDNKDEKAPHIHYIGRYYLATIKIHKEN